MNALKKDMNVFVFMRNVVNQSKKKRLRFYDRSLHSDYIFMTSHCILILFEQV